MFHSLPSVVPVGDLLDVATPFPVLGAAALTLAALRVRGPVLGLALLAATAYASGHGIHLAANSIAERGLHGRAARVADFWDERFGHIWWHLGWLGLLAAICLAERASGSPATARTRALAVAAVLLGLTLFTNTVEGGTWWLPLGAAAVAWPAALRERRPLLCTVAVALALNAVFLAAWAIWQGGVPQFSDLGWV